MRWYGLIFDMDGTLVDNNDAHAQARRIYKPPAGRRVSMKYRTWMVTAALSATAAWAADQTPFAKRAEAEVKSMDTNGDGKVSPEEHAAGAKRMLETIDANKDGKVTAQEMDAAHERVTGAKAGPGEMSAAEKIKVIDADGDGVLTSAEHEAGSKKVFAQIDTDHDGFVTREELVAGFEKMMKKP